MQHLWRETARITVICLAFLLLATSAWSETWVVHLKNGQTLKSTRKPVSAFGKVRYWDAHKRTIVLDAKDVNLEATRKANAGKKVQDSAFIVTGAKAGKFPEQSTPSKSAVMYSATWCGACKTAKAWLRSKGASVRVIEVDRLQGRAREDALRKMQAMGATGFPTLVLGGRMVRGYSPQAWSAALGLK